MHKFLLIPFLIAASSPAIAEKRGQHCKDNYHEVCGYDNTIAYIHQKGCDGAEENCRGSCHHLLELDVDDFSVLAPLTFRNSNFLTIKFFSKSGHCERKSIKLTPQSFKGLSTVQVLKLDCMKFALKANPFKELSTIRGLYLSRMELADLPDYFFSKFSILSQVMFQNVNIPTITNETFAGVNKRLQVLQLISTNLSAIDGKYLRQFKVLMKLEISNNPLADLVPDMFLELDELIYLYLEDNLITVVRNNTFGILPNLETLSLKGNQIREIEAGAFSGLPIEYLDLSRNKLVSLPAGAFKNMEKLGRLSIIFNKISTLSGNIFEGLENHHLNLNLSHNNIHHIEPNTFLGLTLVSLDLDANDLKVLENDTFNGLRIQEGSSLLVSKLSLSKNGITEVKEHAFRNFSAPLITLDSIVGGDRESWHLDENIEIHHCDSVPDSWGCPMKSFVTNWRN